MVKKSNFIHKTGSRHPSDSKEGKKLGDKKKHQNRPPTSGFPPKAGLRAPQLIASENNILLYGLHTVEAALRNPERRFKRIRLTTNAFGKLQTLVSERNLTPELVEGKELDHLLGPDSVHQGVLLEAKPLPALALEDLTGQSPVLLLDQITDPHNVGAILRSAAAFDVKAVIMTERNSPLPSGVLAKAASGGLELVPLCLVTNLARTLDYLGDAGYWRIGLDGEGQTPLEKQNIQGPVALALGAEGDGLRRLTREKCDEICRLSTANALASLNVSNASAIALHSIYCAIHFK